MTRAFESTHAANQVRTFLSLFAELRPHVHTDRNLPARLQQRLARERRFGSRDRRLYRELFYTAVRFLPWFERALARSEDDAVRALVWLAADLPATHALKQSLVADLPATPATVLEKGVQLGATEPPLPAWFRPHCPAAFASPQVDTLHTRAPLWLRLQTDAPDAVFAEFGARGWTWRASEILPAALELLADADVTATDAYKNGRVEVQDLGSQLILAAVAPRAGERWLDACAGAGGKTLQLARLLGPRGHVDATDPRPAAVEELSLRSRRAGLNNVATLRTAPVAPATPKATSTAQSAAASTAGSVPAAPPSINTPLSAPTAPHPTTKTTSAALYDGVLVDAPCSGSGTWRRSPHLKWCTRESDVTAAAALQREILARNAPHVRPGGLLVYATCSLSHVENEDVVSAFLADHPDFAPAPLAHTFGYASPGASALSILPATHNTDAFFVAALRRKAVGPDV